MYEFKFRLTENDFLEFNKLHALESKTGRKGLMIYRVCIPILIGALILFYPISMQAFGKNTLMLCFLIFVIAFVIWQFLAKPLFIFVVKKRAKRMNKQGKAEYSKDTAVRFEDDFFYTLDDEGEAKLKYSIIQQIKANDFVVCMYISVIQAYILPCHVFESVEIRDEFLAFIDGKRNAADKTL